MSMRSNRITNQRLSHILGRNLKRLRQEADQTQKEACNAVAGNGLFWSQGQFSNAERGARETWGLEELFIICYTYDVPMHEMIHSGSHPVSGVFEVIEGLAIHTDSLQKCMAGDSPDDEDIITHPYKWFQKHVWKEVK